MRSVFVYRFTLCFYCIAIFSDGLAIIIIFNAHKTMVDALLQEVQVRVRGTITGTRSVFLFFHSVSPLRLFTPRPIDLNDLIVYSEAV